MGCTGSRAAAYTIEVLPEPTSRPLEALLNDRDAEGIRGHSSRLASDSGGRYFFGAGAAAVESPLLESGEFDNAHAVEVGSGGFGSVFATLHLPTGAIVAVKRIRKSRDSRFRREIDMETNALNKLQGCPFVVRFYGRMESKASECFVLQLLQGGELYAHLNRTPGKRFSEAVARFYAAELVTCVAAVHAKGMAYRDLKPENLCLDADGHIALVDFGFCCEVDDRGIAHGHVGTPYFMSPEILNPRSKETGYPAQVVDWWAVGCALWEMLAGRHPFGNSSMTKHEVFIKITHGKTRPPMALSADARSLLSSMLDLDYKQRLKTPEDIRRHAWFRDIPWAAVAERRVRPPWVPALASAADCRYFPASRGKSPHTAAPPGADGSGSATGSHGSARRGSRVAVAPARAAQRSAGSEDRGAYSAGPGGSSAADAADRVRGQAAAVRRRQRLAGEEPEPAAAAAAAAAAPGVGAAASARGRRVASRRALQGRVGAAGATGGDRAASSRVLGAAGASVAPARAPAASAAASLGGGSLVTASRRNLGGSQSRRALGGPEASRAGHAAVAARREARRNASSRRLAASARR